MRLDFCYIIYLVILVTLPNQNHSSVRPFKKLCYIDFHMYIYIYISKSLEVDLHTYRLHIDPWYLNKPQQETTCWFHCVFPNVEETFLPPLTCPSIGLQYEGTWCCEADEMSTPWRFANKFFVPKNPGKELGHF